MGSGTMTPAAFAKARDALWMAMCFNISVADCRGFSQSSLMPMECPQSLQVIAFPVVMYITQGYALVPSRADHPDSYQRAQI